MYLISEPIFTVYSKSYLCNPLKVYSKTRARIGLRRRLPKAYTVF